MRSKYEAPPLAGRWQDSAARFLYVQCARLLTLARKMYFDMQAFLTALDTALSRTWREEDRAWRKEDREWRSQDMDFRVEERDWWHLEHLWRQENRKWRKQDIDITWSEIRILSQHIEI